LLFDFNDLYTPALFEVTIASKFLLVAAPLVEQLKENLFLQL
jgi:hypothetical protein